MSPKIGAPRLTAPPAEDVRASNVSTAVGAAALPDSADHEFVELVDHGLSEVTTGLAAIWHSELAPGWTADVLAGQDLPQLLQRFLAGGKRIRPKICFWGWVAAGGRGTSGQNRSSLTDVVRVSVALELLHVFALIHDDVMDESPSRRGRPSLHTAAARLHVRASARGNPQRFGESIAILVGDLAHGEADHLVRTLPESMRSLWRLMVIELVCGQSRDLVGAAAGRNDVEHARRVAWLKTGSYTIQRPLQLGLAAAALDPTQSDVLSTTYGRAVGEAFALRDDLLGVWGDPQLTGKPAGDDLLSGKPTLILALGHERLTGSSRQLLARAGARLSSDDVAELQVALVRAGIVDEIEARIDAQIASAVSSLERPGIDPAGADGLAHLARQIAWRNC